MQYQVFVRTWWKRDRMTGQLVPHRGRKTILGYTNTREEARAMCHEYNSTHEPGELSRKAEFTSDF